MWTRCIKCEHQALPGSLLEKYGCCDECGKVQPDLDEPILFDPRKMHEALAEKFRVAVRDAIVSALIDAAALLEAHLRPKP